MRVCWSGGIVAMANWMPDEATGNRTLVRGEYLEVLATRA